METKQINKTFARSLVSLLLATTGLIGCGGQPTEDIAAFSNTSLEFQVAPTANVPAGAEMPLVVRIVDDSGNPVTIGEDATELVTISLLSGSGSLLGTLSRNAVDGVANFAGMGISMTSLGAKSIRATKTGNFTTGAQTVDANFTVIHGAANTVIYTLQPVDPTAPGGNILVDLQIEDSYGNVVDSGVDSTANVTLSLQAGTGALAGTLIVAAVAGVASFTATEAVNIATAGTGKVIRASKADTSGSGGTGVLTVDSNSFEIALPPAPTGLSLNDPATSPSNDDTPEITVSGVVSGNTVNIYTDALCSSAVVGTGVASGATIDITLSPALAEASYTFYANQVDPSLNASNCSTANVAYDLDLTLPAAATLLALNADYSPDSANSPLFSWVQSVSGDVASHTVALGTTSGGEEIVAYTTPDTGTTHTFTSLSLTECSGGLPVYYPSVRVTDNAGNTADATHATGFRYDNTAPTAPGIPSVAADASATESASANWTASVENCQFERYEYAIGTSAGADDVVAWMDIGTVTSYQAVNGVDGVTLSLNNGVYYYTSVRGVDEVGLVSTVSTSAGWRYVVAPDAVTDLAYAGRTITSIDLSWTAPADNGAAITDYLIEYKETASGTWLNFDDGTSSSTIASVTGLTASTSYDFRIRAVNGGTSGYSNILTQETAPNDPFFDPSVYSAMNCGGATASTIVALDDNTNIDINGAPMAGSPLNAGEVINFVSALGDVIEADKPIFVAGRLFNGQSGAWGDANVVWNTPDWAAKDFIFVGSRSAEHVVTVYAFEATNITIDQGATNHVLNDPIAAGSFQTYRLPNNAGYTLTSTGTITAYQYSENTTNQQAADSMPIIPPANDIVGVSSRTGQYTTLAASTSYNWYESDNTTAGGTLTQGVFASATGNGSQYSGPGARAIANDPIIGRSNADSDGANSSPYIPKSFMKQRYAVNHLSEWVSFVSDKPAVIQYFRPGQPQASITLTRTGTGANTPYFGRLTNMPQGTIFESNERFAAWYESDEAANTYSSREDETVMFGADGNGLPVNHKLKLWLDASDSATLYQADDCTSVVSADGEEVGCWKDKSLQGNDAVQTGANKPTWDAQVEGFANAPGVDFNGGTNYLDFAQSIVDSTEYTIFAVVHRDTTGGNNYFIGTQSGTANQGLHLGFDADASARLGQVSNDLSMSVPGQANSSVGLMWGKLDSSGKELYYNGASTTDATATQLTTPGQGVIGRGYDGNGFDGQVAEIIVFTRALSTYEIELMEEYLREKWLRPTLLSNVRLWLDSSDETTLFTDGGCSTGVTTSGDNVLCWKDKGGNGYSAVTDAGTPLWQADGSRNIVAFTNDSLRINGGASGAVFVNSTTLSQADVFAIMKSSSSVENGYLFHHPAGNGFAANVPWGGNVQFDLDAGASGSISAAWGADTVNYFRWNFVSDSVGSYQEIFRDDNSVVNDANASTMAIGLENFYIGVDSGTSNFQNMNLGSLLIFEDRLTDAERHMIRAYLDSKWGL